MFKRKENVCKDELLKQDNSMARSMTTLNDNINQLTKNYDAIKLTGE